MDLVGPLNPSDDNYMYILSVQDGFSRFLQLFPLRSKTSAEVTRTIVEKFIGVFGCPTAIHSDQGKEFVSEVWQGLMQALQIRVEQGPLYNPHSNPVERAHRTIHQLMRTMLQRED